jgi:transposase
MSKQFRAWKIDEIQLLPPSVQDYVGKDHLARLIVALVRESLDLSEIVGRYRSGVGQPPFDPWMMTALLLHGYASGVYSSRRIAKAAEERADFMMIVAGDPPDFRTISDFRQRHLGALAGLFVQVLQLAEKAGLVKLGHVALDGTKIKANASKHKAMSYERMKKREAELKAEVERWLKAAEAADAEEDRLHGHKRGDEMPDWVADKQKRLQKIRAAKAELEARVTLLPAPWLAGPFPQALHPYRLPQSIARRRLATVRAVQSEPALKFRDPCFQRRVFSPQRPNQREQFVPGLESKTGSAVERNLSPIHTARRQRCDQPS